MGYPPYAGLSHAGVPGVIAGKFPVSSNWFVISMLQGEFYGSRLLAVAAVMRVAKNPVKSGHIHVLIFKVLRKLVEPWLQSNDFGHFHYRKKTANNACNPIMQRRCWPINS